MTRIVAGLVGIAVALGVWGLGSSARSAEGAAYPGKTWEARPADEIGMSASGIEYFWRYVGGRGCLTRNGYLVHTWGDPSRRADVASAAKPLYSFFLFKAVEERRISGLDAPVALFEPRLKELNPELGHKDARITWRHLASQTSGYGVREEPGKAFDYNDFQTALFWDTLFLKVYGASPSLVDAQVFNSRLGDALQFEDDPTLLAFGPEDRVGRLSISPRDFARFGLLYLRRGEWKGRPLLSHAHVQAALGSPLPNSIPQTAGQAAPMLPGQRTIGSRAVPDNQTDHLGSYSFMWWTNGTDRAGKRHWPDAPADAVAALGHSGKEALVLFPASGVVASWNEARVDGREMENEALRRLAASILKGGGERQSQAVIAP